MIGPSVRGRGAALILSSVEHRGRGFVYPERLDGRKDLLLVASQGHAHSQQVSMETASTDSDEDPNRVRQRGGDDGGESYSVLRWETTSRLVKPACRKFCS